MPTPPEQRATLAAVGSVTHAAHALRAFLVAGQLPSGFDRFRQALDQCTQAEGIYPLGGDGMPVISNRVEPKHAESNARHTATGLVGHVYAGIMGKVDRRSWLEVRRRLSHYGSMLSDDLTRLSQGKGPGPMQAFSYAVETAAHAAAVGEDAWIREVAGKATEALLGWRRNGLWLYGDRVQSAPFYSALATERLVWASQSNLLDSALARDASEAARLATDTVVREWTHAESGGVCLDPQHAVADFGTTARWARIAALTGHEAFGRWLAYVCLTPGGVLDPVAHTHTWEACVLLGVLLCRSEVQAAIGPALARFHQGLSESVGQRFVRAMEEKEYFRAQLVDHLFGDVGLSNAKDVAPAAEPG